MRARLALACVLLAACTPGGSGSTDDSSSTATLHACNPFEGAASSIALVDLVAAGKHADGTIYVIDRGRPEYRVFVSSGTDLVRTPSLGSGTTPDSVSVSSRDAKGAFDLKVDLAGAQPTRMGVHRGPPLDTKTFEIGTQGDVLTLLGAGALSGLTVRDLPATVLVEHDGRMPDGRRIVVTRPEHDWTYDDFRVFFGPESAMLERPMKGASRGSTTYVTFDLDGVTKTAVFPSALAPNTPAELRTEGGGSEPLTVLDATATPAATSLAYQCR